MATPKSKDGMPRSQESRRRVSPAGIDMYREVSGQFLNGIVTYYKIATAKSRAAGKSYSFRIDVDPAGATNITPVEETSSVSARLIEEPVVTRELGTPDARLPDALAAARERGRLRAAEILGGDDMLTADDFAKLIGTTRVTVNTKRQSGQILGLEGAKRGFRFPNWQLNDEGKPYPELATLHERLGGAWAVYRFLVQPHAELDGLTGREALEQGSAKAVMEAAESVGRDFR